MPETTYRPAPNKSSRPSHLRPPLSTVAPSEQIENWMDRIGIWLSGLCLIHCVGTVVLLALLPMMNFSEEHHEWFHIVLAVVLPLVAFVAFVPGYRRHHDRRVIGYGILGLVLVVFGALESINHLDHVGQAIVTSCGSVCLIAAHLRNRKLNACSHPHHAHC